MKKVDKLERILEYSDLRRFDRKEAIEVYITLSHYNEKKAYQRTRAYIEYRTGGDWKEW